MSISHVSGDISLIFGKIDRFTLTSVTLPNIVIITTGGVLACFQPQKRRKFEIEL